MSSRPDSSDRPNPHSAPGDPGARRVLTVVIADDHALYREGLVEILQSYDDIVVVGEAATGDEAAAQVARLRPDVLLLDVEMPGPEAADTVAAVQKSSPATGVVILSMYDGPELVHRLVAAGACAYLFKSVSRHELVAALRGISPTPSPDP